jgi:hypothetical protein
MNERKRAAKQNTKMTQAFNEKLVELKSLATRLTRNTLSNYLNECDID